MKQKIHWAKQLLLNKIKREKYHMKKYGNLKKLEIKDEKLQYKMDEQSMSEEMELTK